MEDGYIEDMAKWISVDLSLNNSFEKFSVDAGENKIYLSPNTNLGLRINVNYQFLSGSFEYGPEFLPGNNDDSDKGKTRSFSLGTSFIFSHWWFETGYSKVRGYYLENTDDYISWSPGDPYIQFPELEYQGFELLTGYSTNSKFSFKSLTSQTERQLKSAGSFIPALMMRYYTVDNKEQSTTSQRSDCFEAILGPGYAYTFVLREEFYLSLGLIASLGYLSTDLTTRLPGGDVKTHQDNLIFRWQGRTGVGYNGPRLYTGLYGTLAGSQYDQENTTAINRETRVFFHLFLGYRFKAPQKMQEAFSKVQGLIPD